jgi:hypothetical protein
MNGIQGRKGVTPEMVAAYKTTVAGVADAIWSPLFDYQTYPLAGSLGLNFFSVPQGQGTTSAPNATGVKTLADTNMQVAAQLPRGNRFLCVGIEVEFWPAADPGLALTAVPTAAQTGRNSGDVYRVLKSGSLTLTIQQRVYAQDAPLMKFPTQTRLAMAATNAAVNTNATVVNYQQIEYASGSGAGYSIIPVYIESTQYFTVTLNWPALVPTQSTADARIGVRLLGNLIRDAQ